LSPLDALEGKAKKSSHNAVLVSPV